MGYTLQPRALRDPQRWTLFVVAGELDGLAVCTCCGRPSMLVAGRLSRDPRLPEGGYPLCTACVGFLTLLFVQAPTGLEAALAVPAQEGQRDG